MRLRNLTLILLVFSVVFGNLLTASCAGKTEAPTQITEDVSAEQAFNLIQENRSNPDFIIIDVRTPEEFNDGHIENALNIDFRSDNFSSEIDKLDRDNTYLVYCKSGGRSRGAVDMMLQMDFKEVYNLVVGITGWIEEGLITVK
jgi:rhodanese-related sulfurtransferase